MLRLFIIGQFFAPFLIAILLISYILLNQYTGYFSDNLLVDIGLWGSFQVQKAQWLLFVAGGLIFLNAFLLNRLFNRNNFSEKNTWIVALVYVVLMSFYHTFYYIDGVTIAHTFLVLSVYQLFDLESNLDGRKASFNAGFLFGVAASFHPALLFIFPLLWLMITRIRPFVFREIILASVGFCVPLIYGFSLVFYQNQAINWNFIEKSLNYSQKEINFLIYVGLFAVAALVGIVGFRIKLAKSSIRFRKLAAIIVLCLVAGISIGTLQYIILRKYEWFSFGMIGLSLFLSFSFFNKKTEAISSILLYLLLGFSFAKFFI